MHGFITLFFLMFVAHSFEQKIMSLCFVVVNGLPQNKHSLFILLKLYLHFFEQNLAECSLCFGTWNSLPHVKQIFFIIL
jgi:hypothetical protein